MKPLVRLLVLIVCGATASAQVRVAISRPMPTSAAVGLQQFLGSSEGAPLLAMHPGLRTVLGLDVSNSAHLQILGSLSARLPEDFAARAAADAGAARAMFSVAYVMSGNDAVGEIDARAGAAIKSAASDVNAWRDLGSVASDFKSYSLYGEAARERVTLFTQKAAAVRSQKLANDLLLELLRGGLRGPEPGGGIPAEAVDENSYARRHARLSHVPVPSGLPKGAQPVRVRAVDLPATAPSGAVGDRGRPARAARAFSDRATEAAPRFVPFMLGPSNSNEWLEPAAEFTKSVRMTPDGLQVLMKDGGLQEYRFRFVPYQWEKIRDVSPWGVVWEKWKDRFVRAVGWKNQNRPLAELRDKQELYAFDKNSGGRTYRWNKAAKLWYEVRSERSGPALPSVDEDRSARDSVRIEKSAEVGIFLILTMTGLAAVAGIALVGGFGPAAVVGAAMIGRWLKDLYALLRE